MNLQDTSIYTKNITGSNFILRAIILMILSLFIYQFYSLLMKKIYYFDTIIGFATSIIVILIYSIWNRLIQIHNLKPTIFVNVLTFFIFRIIYNIFEERLDIVITIFAIELIFRFIFNLIYSSDKEINYCLIIFLIFNYIDLELRIYVKHFSFNILQIILISITLISKHFLLNILSLNKKFKFNYLTNFEYILDQLKISYITINLDGKLISYNNTYVSIIYDNEYSNDSLVNFSIDDTIHPKKIILDKDRHNFFIESAFKEFFEINQNLNEETKIYLNQIKNNSNMKVNLITLINKLSHFKINDYIDIGVFKIKHLTEDKYLLMKVKINKENQIIEIMLVDKTDFFSSKKKYFEVKNTNYIISKIVHDIKNPLITISCIMANNNILNNTLKENDSSDDDDDDDEEVKRLRRKSKISDDSHKNSLIINLCNYILILIEDLNNYASKDFGLTLNTIKSINIPETDLFPILDFSINIFKSRQLNDDKKHNINIYLRIDDNVPRKVFGFDMRLKQILVNLLSNSYKFTQFGEISVYVTMIMKNDKQYTRISVRDTGLGISEDDKNKLFYPFSMLDNKENEGGSGLGLMIVSDLLSLMNTSIHMESVKNIGSNFWFDLDIPQNQINFIRSNGTLADSSCENTLSIIDQERIYTESMTNLIKHLNLQTSTNVSEKNDKDYVIIFETQEENFSNTDLIKRISLNDLVYDLKKYSDKNIRRVNEVMRKFSSKKNLFSSKLLIQAINRDKHIDNEYLSDGFLISKKNKKIKENIKSIDKQSFKRKSKKFETYGPTKSLLNLGDEILLLPKKSTPRIINKEIKILICDDESINITSTKKVLVDTCNHLHIKSNIQIFLNGIECLYNIFNKSLRGDYYDIVFIDESMPCMNGSEVVKIIRNMVRDRQIPELYIYSVTAYDMETMKNLKTIGTNGILNKPISKTQIMNIINKLINN